jgi:hypothetical protein
MDNPLVGLALFVLAFAVLDLIALRYGFDSRSKFDGPRDW